MWLIPVGHDEVVGRLHQLLLRVEGFLRHLIHDAKFECFLGGDVPARYDKVKGLFDSNKTG
jgi:hypothetical protein